MLERVVDIGGVLYARHSVIVVEHNYGAMQTICQVHSTGEDAEVDTWHPMALTEGITHDQAEAFCWALPDFAEVEDQQSLIDEMAALLTDEQAEQVPQAYPEWAAGTEYEAGQRVRDGLLYRCVQAHTSQDGWEPHATPSLWVRTSTDEWPEWVQPTGAHDAYGMGDKVSHNGSHWVSTMDANVFEPGVAGWESA